MLTAFCIASVTWPLLLPWKPRTALGCATLLFAFAGCYAGATGDAVLAWIYAVIYGAFAFAISPLKPAR